MKGQTDHLQSLLDILQTNKTVQIILNRANELGIQDWYLGAGGINQTVWNFFHGFDPEYGIKDYDLVYYDPDTSYDAEDAKIKRGAQLFHDVLVPVEIRNQARVHVWYKDHFGYPIQQYLSTERAIATWPTTAGAIGVRKEVDGQMTVYAPFGLEDLFEMVVRPNKIKITSAIYQDKIDRWIKIWPKIKVIPW